MPIPAKKPDLDAITRRLQTAKKTETREKRMSEIVAMLSNGRTLYPFK